jgi:hypothetical protein
MKQAEMVRGLLEAAMTRPSSFADTADRPPPKGSFCGTCQSRRWWYPARPAADGTGPSAHWRCATCRPPRRPGKDQSVEAAT